VTLFGAVRVVCTVLAVLFLAAAATIALVPLPTPSAGGTCGPGTSSESAIIAFFNPASIHAGPEPTVTSGERPQWSAFISQCQSATNTRMVQTAVIVVGALLAGLGVPWALRRLVREDTASRRRLPPPGWYPDPTDPNVPRWWDERGWGPPYAPPGHAVSISTT